MRSGAFFSLNLPGRARAAATSSRRREHRAGSGCRKRDETGGGPVPASIQLSLHAGDIRSAAARVMVSTANPGFQLTGGIGALLLETGGATFQQELNSLARQAFGTQPAPRGSVLVSSAAGLPFQAILHVVAIDV